VTLVLNPAATQKDKEEATASLLGLLAMNAQVDAIRSEGAALKAKQGWE
jgi:hypothetical protein